MSSARAMLVATVLGVTMAAGGCGDQDEPVDADPSSSTAAPTASSPTPTGSATGSATGSGEQRLRLERSREEVRAAFDQVGEAMAERLEGRLEEDRAGGYDGCETSGTDQFSSFRYQVRAAVKANRYTVDLPYLEKIRPDLESGGFSPGRPGPLGESATIRTVTGERDGLELSVVENPKLRLVVLTVAGPCLPTDPDDTDFWLAAD